MVCRYVIYACFCAITYIWVSIAVPETKNVALGKDMDTLFAVEKENDYAVLESDAEVSETTALLRKAPSVSERRASVGFAV